MLKLSTNLSLPPDYVTWKAAILGRTGSGKTNTAVVLASRDRNRIEPGVLQAGKEPVSSTSADAVIAGAKTE